MKTREEAKTELSRLADEYDRESQGLWNLGHSAAAEYIERRFQLAEAYIDRAEDHAERLIGIARQMRKTLRNAER